MRNPGNETMSALERHYATVPGTSGFARKCHMNLPEGLVGKHIIDLGCRTGRGVLKLAGRAGADGYVLGVDWTPAHLAAAREYAAERGSKEQRNMAPFEFKLAYPEALDVAGVQDAAFDVAFANCSMNLFFNIPAAFAQIERCLKPGGLLVVDGVFATGPRNSAIVSQARALDNPVQAAPALRDFLQIVADAGFDDPAVEVGEPVPADAGFIEGSSAPRASGEEPVEFRIFVINARKPL